MNIIKIYEQINQINSLKKSCENNIKDLIKSNIDLETKWDVFTASNLGKIDSYTPSFVDDNIYDHNNGPVYCSRHETLLTVDVVDMCEGFEGFDENDFKNNCMKNFIKGWTFDW